MDMDAKSRRLIALLVCVGITGSSAEARTRRSLGIVPAHAPAPPQVEVPTMSMDERRRLLAEGDRP